METYGARVTFMTQHITAENKQQVEDKLNQLIDELGAVKTFLNWDEVDWDIYIAPDWAKEEN